MGNIKNMPVLVFSCLNFDTYQKNTAEVIDVLGTDVSHNGPACRFQNRHVRREICIDQNESGRGKPSEECEGNIFPLERVVVASSSERNSW